MQTHVYQDIEEYEETKLCSDEEVDSVDDEESDNENELFDADMTTDSDSLCSYMDLESRQTIIGREYRDDEEEYYRGQYFAALRARNIPYDDEDFTSPVDSGASDYDSDSS